MTALFHPILMSHIGCGLLAVAVGLAPILTRKGSRPHRLAGRLFVGLTGALLVAAWLMTALRFNAYFAALLATATITLFSGVRVLRRKRPDLDPRQRAAAIDWAAALAVVGVGAWVLVLLLTGRAAGPRATTIALVYAAFI